ncbi:hypothetical protein DPMN_098942 [Dreissena polymorpha]|uniref:Uncharacterized protein n=1 Tax=Dreissena polymorpha TaxID=45954 RepID=A0A9D4LE09_DREPO|nr:hypothetical protein DPMN_098942 [Dreissena polymorpha]
MFCLRVCRSQNYFRLLHAIFCKLQLKLRSYNTGRGRTHRSPFMAGIVKKAPLMLKLHFHAKGDSRTALMQRLLPHLTTGGSIICIYHLRTIYVQSFNNGFYKEMKDMPYST